MGLSISSDSRLIFIASGAHSARYLHNRLSNSIKSLSVSSGCLAAPLSPQGRAEGFYSVTRTGEDQFLLIGDGGSAEEALSALLRYKVADRVEISNLSLSHRVCHVSSDSFSEAASLSDESAALPTGVGSGFFSESRGAVVRNRRGVVGIDFVIPFEQVAEFQSRIVNRGGAILSPEEADRQRILAGIPEFPREISDEAVFLQPLLRSAVSFTKGCYVGQEVLERIDSRGESPFTLVRVRSLGEFQLSHGASLVLNNQEVGTILSSTTDPLKRETVAFALARTRLLDAQAHYSVHGVSASFRLEPPTN